MKTNQTKELQKDIDFAMTKYRKAYTSLAKDVWLNIADRHAKNLKIITEQ